LLARIPRLEEVAEMVGNQHMDRPAQRGTDAIRIGSGLLKVALDFDELVMRGTEPAAALCEMGKRNVHDPRFLAALEQIQVQQAQREVRLLKLTELKTGMTTNSDVRSKAGLLLMGTGQEITASAIARLQAFAITKGVDEPIGVRMPHASRSPEPAAREGAA
jgi:hypothetical protein